MRTFYKTVIMLLTLSAVQTAWADGNNWMASLPDNVYITQLSIPGTHDAATSTCSGVSKTQTYTISQQWEKGVRVFDLRPTDETADGPIYHGSGIFRSSTGTTLRAELGNLKTKLAANSTEFAIVIIRNENNTGQDNGKWKEVIKPILDAYNDVLTEWNPDLRLGDVRGKILVFARDEVTETKAAKVWDWGDNQTYKGDILLNNNGAFHIVLQDYYDNVDTTTKKNAIGAMLDESTTIHSPNRLYINHASGVAGSFIPTPSNCATETNPYICEYLDSHQNVGPTGIIMMDFAGDNGNNYRGADLVNKIIANNNALTANFSGPAGEYYLQNVETGQWIQGYQAIAGADRNRWNTSANMGSYGRPFKPQDYDADGWTLNTLAGDEKLNCEYAGDGMLSLDYGYAGGPTRWKITGPKEKAYITVNHDRWLSVDDNNLLINNNTTRNAWKLWTRDERIEAMSSATEQTPIDVTWLMVNPELMNNDHRTPQWTVSRSEGGEGWQGDFHPNRIYETWNYTSMDFYQTISVPNGNYEVQAYALFSPTEGSGLCKDDYDDYVANGDATVNGYLYANNEQVKLPSIYSFTSTTPVPDYAAKELDGSVSVVDGWWQAARAMGEDGQFHSKPLRVTVTDGQLRLGIKETNNTSPFKSHWIIIGSFSLKYLGVETVTINENTDYTPEAKAYANVTLTRNINANKWNTLVLPFSLTAEQTKAAFGSDVAVAEYSEESADASNATVNFNKKATPSIEANVPVLLKTSTAGTSYTFSGVTIQTGDAKKEGKNFDFVGSYANSFDVPVDNYFISGDKLYKSSGSTTIKGTRAYIAPKTAGARIADIVIDGEGNVITGITDVKTDVQGQGTTYNLNGQRVAQPTKGVFIIDGKKVVIK